MQLIHLTSSLAEMSFFKHLKNGLLRKRLQKLLNNQNLDQNEVVYSLFYLKDIDKKININIMEMDPCPREDSS
jgi:hypothetical protein